MRALERLGIVREHTGKKRNRLFGYEAYLSILNEGDGGVSTRGASHCGAPSLPCSVRGPLGSAC